MSLDDNEVLEIEDMRQARESANSVFIKFTDNKEYFSTHAFCFFEGEDGKYYNSRIRSYFSSYFIPFAVGNKKEVLKLMNKIKSDNLYDKISKMFFIDRDYDLSMKSADEDLYETPCYSIENLYACESCFQQIIQSEFGLNISDNDYTKCIKDFRLRFSEFNEGMIEFNSLVLFRRMKSNSNSNFKFGSVKTNHLYVSKIDKIIKSEKYNKTISDIMNALSINNDDLEHCKQDLVTKGSYDVLFRGKNQLDFMISILNNLKELNNTTTYFESKLRCVKLNITSNRLSELSQYAITPSCLTTFLDNHRKNMVS